MLRTARLLILLLTPVALVACGDSGSPASPSALPSAGSSTINGTALVAGATSAAAQLGAQSVSAQANIRDGIRVCVVGTDVCADVDGAGTFVLNGDFSADVELQFDGRGQNVRVMVVDVQPGETVTVRVELNGNRGTLEVESRDRGRGSEDDGDARRVSLCHVTGNGSYHLITISVDAEQAHIDHGDGYPGEALATDESLTFDDACGLLEQPEDAPEEEGEGPEGREGKVTLCHRTGNGRYRLIEVSESARPAHLAHGDGYPGGSAPSDRSLRFEQDCSVRENG